MASLEFMDGHQDVTVHSPSASTAPQTPQQHHHHHHHRPSLSVPSIAASGGPSSDKDDSLSPAVPSLVHLPLTRQSAPVAGLKYRNLGKSGLRISNVGLGTFSQKVILIFMSTLWWMMQRQQLFELDLLSCAYIMIIESSVIDFTFLAIFFETWIFKKVYRMYTKVKMAAAGSIQAYPVIFLSQRTYTKSYLYRKSFFFISIFITLSYCGSVFLR